MIPILLIIALLVASPSWAARGCYTTDGAATTDVVTTTHATNGTTMSYSMWVWITGAGGGNLGRIFDKGTNGGTGFRGFIYQDTVPNIQFIVDWSGTDGTWTIARPTTGAWHHIVLTYDGSAAANNPIVYVDGSSVTVTTGTAPTTALVAADASVYTLCNRSDGIRGFNGRLAEWAYWQGTILSAGNVTSLWNGGAGLRADQLATAPTLYFPLCGKNAPEVNQVNGATSGTVTGTLKQTHPFANCGSGLQLLGVGR